MQKIQFALDIAQAMAWCSGLEPKVIHRSLDPNKVFVHENWTCKVSSLLFLIVLLLL